MIRLNYLEFINLKGFVFNDKDAEKEPFKQPMTYVMFDVKKQRVMSTDGHRLFMVEQKQVSCCPSFDSDEQKEKWDFLRQWGEDTKVFVSFKDIVMLEGGYLTLELGREIEGKQMMLCVVYTKGEKQYRRYNLTMYINLYELPEVDKVIPSPDTMRKPIFLIGFNHNLLPIAKSVDLIFYDKNLPIRVEIYDKKGKENYGIKQENITCLIMPYRDRYKTELEVE
jgi:hypothetical protein